MKTENINVKEGVNYEFTKTDGTIVTFKATLGKDGPKGIIDGKTLLLTEILDGGYSSYREIE